MNDLRSSGSNPSSVNHPSLSVEALAAYAAWEWDIISGDVQWFGVHEQLARSLPRRGNGNIQACTDMLHPDDRARWWEKLNDLMARRDIPYADECRIIRPDGCVRWVSVTGRIYYDETGKAVRMTGVLQDITERKQTEATLHEREERLRLAQSAANIGTFDWDIQSNQSLWSPETERIWGLPVGGFGGTYEHWLRQVHPDDVAEAERIVRLSLENPDIPYKYEHRIIRPDGTVRWIHANATTRRDAAGQPIRMVGVNFDITERKEAEAKLFESELRLRTLVERIGDVFWIADPKQKRLIYVSQAFEDLWGRSLGRLHEHFETWLEGIHEEDRERVKQDFYANIYAGQYDSEYRVVRPDGTIRWIRDHGKPLGIGNLVAGVAEDITERKEAEKALRESEARFRNVFEHAGTGISIADLGGNFMQCNPAFCAMLGYTEDELRHVHFSEVVHAEDRDANVAKSLRLIAEELPHYEIENRYVHKNGEPIWVRKFISLMRDHDRRAKYVLVLVTDITARRKAEQALLHAQRRLQWWNKELEQAVNEKTAELVRSQERLRALTSELNLAEQRERKRLATELHDHLQQMLVLGKLEIGRGKRFAIGIPACETALKRVDDILSDALTYSRTLVAELSPPVLREHGLATGLKWLAEYMKKKHRQTVTVIVLEDHGLTLPEDQRVLLFQSVRELLINASKHAGTHEATVQMTQSENEIRIEVRDQGVGFDLATAGAVAGLPSGEISSKFGLFSIRERMRALGGRFDIHSTPGQGTTATLMLPLVKSAEMKVLSSEMSGSNSALKAQHSAPQKNATVRVLLVDDHVMVRQGLRSVLDAYDDIQIVGEAQDGAEAVRLVGELQPQVVVMDINMPKMSGIEATARIKTNRPGTIVLGISVNTGDDNGNAMRRAGAAVLLNKEAAVDDLYRTIQDLLKTNE